ncbi:hypothetical protein AYO21_09519 [Fonsecaea monophora]|uniref:Uncharacterized protein n=1 Tax=Fonsecaea monophora TaxID=254056 RepID=A0A177EW59_9EURO|nr:hypothetical protein AYO21_09519 [Fonsecaea monophora]OAG36277.1 hypothetical protein AYO21_09519 [Fonsecaea monophora]
MAPFVVDNEAKIDALVTLVTKRMRVEQAQLTFVDLEGVNLTQSLTNLVDVHQLKAKAFDLTTVDGTGLEMVLDGVFKHLDSLRHSQRLGCPLRPLGRPRRGHHRPAGHPSVMPPEIRGARMSTD